MTKVVLDAVGGDDAPKECLAGVVLALQRGFVAPEQLILTGPREALLAAMRTHGVPASVEVVDAPDVLTSDDSPTDAMKKKPRNSIAIGIQQVKEGRAGAFVSAGSTGTVVAAATLGLRCLEGIRRPAIGAIIHGEKNPFLVLDVGGKVRIGRRLELRRCCQSRRGSAVAPGFGRGRDDRSDLHLRRGQRFRYHGSRNRGTADRCCRSFDGHRAPAGGDQ